MTTDDLAGIGPTPPAWCEPDTKPDWSSLTMEGTSPLSWCRDVGEVWIAADDTLDENGNWSAARPRIGFCEPPAEGLDAAGARRMAADLLNAADLLDG